MKIFETLDPAWFSPSCPAAIIEQFKLHGGYAIFHMELDRSEDEDRKPTSLSPRSLVRSTIKASMFFVSANDAATLLTICGQRYIHVSDCAWVSACIRAGKLLDFDGFMLHPGKSLSMASVQALAKEAQECAERNVTRGLNQDINARKADSTPSKSSSCDSPSNVLTSFQKSPETGRKDQDDLHRKRLREDAEEEEDEDEEEGGRLYRPRGHSQFKRTPPLAQNRPRYMSSTPINLAPQMAFGGHQHKTHQHSAKTTDKHPHQESSRTQAVQANKQQLDKRIDGSDLTAFLEEAEKANGADAGKDLQVTCSRSGRV